VELRNGKEAEVARKKVPKTKKIFLRMEVRNGREMRFFHSNNNRRFSALTMNALDGGYLPPWDRAIRAGITAKGAEGMVGVFDNFELVNQ
jgi:xylan 1,4-beta-xylosidase